MSLTEEFTPYPQNENYKLIPTERGDPLIASIAAQKEGWGQADLEMGVVWDMEAGDGSRTVVMVPDTGLYDHIDIPEPLDAHNSTGESIKDRNNHSTWICGAIAAKNNEIGYRGYANNAHLIPIKVLKDSGNGSDNAIHGAMRWAINWWSSHPKRPAKYGGTGEFLSCFYSMSYGGGGYSQTEFDLFQDMIEVGMIPCASSGNGSRNRPGPPAAYEGVRAHGAFGPGREKAAFTNFGPWTDAVGPGVNVPSTVGHSEWGFWSGTSMSNPIIVSCGASFVSAHPNDTWLHDFYGFNEAMLEHMQPLPGSWAGPGVFLPADAITRNKHFIF